MPFLNELPWKDAEAYFAERDDVVIGVGAIHAHDHIPAGIDNLSTDYFLREIEKGTGTLVVPNLPFGPMDNYMDYPGTISLSGPVFTAVVREIVRDMVRWGARRIYVVNGHGGNTPHLLDVGYEFREQGCLVPVLEWWKLIRTIDPDLDRRVNALPGSAQPGRRARTRGTEAAAAMALLPESMLPESVRVIYARELLSAPFDTRFATAVTYRGTPVPLPFGSRETTEIGEVGTEATAEMGQQILRACADFMVGFIKDLNAQGIPAFNGDRT